MGAFLLLGLKPSGRAQSPQTPLLRQALARAAADTTRTLLLADLSATFRYSRFDSVRYYAQQGLALARRIGYAKGEGRCLSRLALLQAERGNLPQALRTDLRAMHLHQEAHDAVGLARTLNQTGLLYQALDDYRPALAYYRRAKAIYDHIPQPDDSQLVSVLTNLGSTYVGRRQLDSAAYFLHQAYALTRRSTNVAHSCWGTPMPYVLRELGLLAAAQGRTDTAISYYHRSARAALPENDRRSACRAYQYLAELYHAQGQPDSSTYYARRALRMGQLLPYVVGVVRTSRLLVNVFQVRRQRDSTLKYLLIQQTAEDTLYDPRRINQLDAIGFAEQQRLRQLEEEREEYDARLRSHALWGSLGTLALVVLGLSYYNRRQRRANAELQRLNTQVTNQSQELTSQRDRLADMLQELRTTQQQLVLREKMASLGELMAGVAHEIQQPAQAIRNLAGVSEQLCQELRQELVKGEELQPADLELLDEMLLTLARHQAKIGQHGQRTAGIVRGIMEYSGTQPAVRQATDLNALAEDYLRLTYHDMRAKQRHFHAALLPRLDPAVGTVEVVRHDFGRVLISLFANAFYAVLQRRQQAEAAEDDDYVPQVMLTTERTGPQEVRISVRDNGAGIPAEAQPHVFERFFSTKPADEGPGLGLALSHDIVRSLGGTLTLRTEPGAFTELIITLPVPAVSPALA